MNKQYQLLFASIKLSSVCYTQRQPSFVMLCVGIDAIKSYWLLFYATIAHHVPIVVDPWTINCRLIILSLLIFNLRFTFQPLTKFTYTWRDSLTIHYQPQTSKGEPITHLKVDLDALNVSPSSFIFCRRTTTNRPLHNGITAAAYAVVDPVGLEPTIPCLQGRCLTIRL